MTRLANKLNVADLAPAGLPLRALAAANIPDTDTKTAVHLGVIMGWASGLSYRSNPNGEMPSVALTGAFETVPSDPSTEVVRAATLYLPSGVQNMIVAMMQGDNPAPVEKLNRGQKIDVPAERVKILFEISVRRNAATGGAGYEYLCSQIGDAEKEDVFADLRAELPAPGTRKAIAAPAGEKPKAVEGPKAATRSTGAKKKGR